VDQEDRTKEDEGEEDDDDDDDVPLSVLVAKKKTSNFALLFRIDRSLFSLLESNSSYVL